MPIFLISETLLVVSVLIDFYHSKKFLQWRLRSNNLGDSLMLCPFIIMIVDSMLESMS